MTSDIKKRTFGTMETIKATNLRKSIYETLERVRTSREPVEVVLAGLPAAVLMPVSVLEPGGKKPPIDLDAISAFCQKYQVKTLSLFGSIMQADFNATSDVDVLINLGNRKIDFHELIHMTDHLEAIFGRAVNVIESSNLGQLDKLRRREITAAKMTIYEEVSFNASSQPAVETPSEAKP